MDGESGRGGVLAPHIMGEVVICASACSQRGNRATRGEEGDKEKDKEEEKRGMKADSGE